MAESGTKELAEKPFRIAFLTESRSEWGAMENLCRAVFSAEETAGDLILGPIIVCGQHFADEQGRTWDLVHEAFPGRTIVCPFAKARADRERDGKWAEGGGIARADWGQIEAALDGRLKPDLLVVFGDLPRALAAATIASKVGVPVAHVHAGDVTWDGHPDNRRRWAITCLSDYVFVPTEEACARINDLWADMGRALWDVADSVFRIGSPFMDIPDEITDFSKNAWIPDALFLVHPETYGKQSVGFLEKVRRAAEALRVRGLKVLAFRPNRDPGWEEIDEIIREGYSKYPNWKIVSNLKRADFLGLLNHAKLLVGNSSSACLEARYFQIVPVYIGKRQIGRVRDYCGEVLTYHLEGDQVLDRALKIFKQGKSDWVAAYQPSFTEKFIETLRTEIIPRERKCQPAMRSP